MNWLIVPPPLQTTTDHDQDLSGGWCHSRPSGIAWHNFFLQSVGGHFVKMVLKCGWRSGMGAPPRPAPRKKGCPAPPRPAPRKLAKPAGRGGAKFIWIPWKLDRLILYLTSCPAERQSLHLACWPSRQSSKYFQIPDLVALGLILKLLAAILLFWAIVKNWF